MSPETYNPTQIKVKLEIDLQDAQEVFELMCEIPWEQTQMSDTEPRTDRHPAIESLLSQLQAVLSKDEDIE